MASLKSLRLFLIGLLSLLQPTAVLAETADAFQFFQEEAKVISASHQPVNRQQAPATVYVVTSQDIQNSGAQTIWEALRGVPGLDVMQTRTDQGEVSIRGLDKAANNRTLILLDGKSVLNPYFDYVSWESIPVTMPEIDRIEIVEGPASAVYGANAVNGVINIITKTPEQLHGGLLSYTGGERNTQLASYTFGRKLDKWAYKLGGGWNSMNQFEEADRFASQAGKFNAFAGYTVTPECDLSFAGGVTDLNTQMSVGSVGNYYNKGYYSFARSDFRYQKTKLHGFWSENSSTLDQLAALGNTTQDSNTYQTDVEQSISLPWRNELVVGADYQRKTARSSTLPPGLFAQDLWSLFGEDRWDLSDHWSLTGSGRVDRHPYTAIMFSPRGSLIYAPLPEQTFRVSAGTAFRNPTILENAIVFTSVSPNPGTSLPNPPFTTIQTSADGNRNLDSERIQTVEIAHNGQFGPFQTSVAGFHYTLKQIITTTPIQVTGFTPQSIQTGGSYTNVGQISAWGTELGLQVRMTSWLSSYANYSFQDLQDQEGSHDVAEQSPRHKANVGLTAKHRGFTSDLQVHWVDATRWLDLNNAVVPVNAYFLVNAHVGYAFSGRWDGVEAGVTAFNLLNHDHYESLPSQNGLPASELIRSRWTGTVSYKF